MRNSGGSDNLNEDTLGSILKVGLAQCVALEFSRGNYREVKVASRYLPWLFQPPSAVSQGFVNHVIHSLCRNHHVTVDHVTLCCRAREFVESVGHIRVLSWLLLGSLTHTAIARTSAHVISTPVPLSSSAVVADVITVILTGFPEQSKV